MTNYATGHLAEKLAAQYLTSIGFEIVAINWKNKACEIDIIAKKNRVIHFIEVKYRQTSSQGTGFDYITPKKLQRMAFAAELWVQQYNWPDDYCLSAIEMAGPDFEITNFIEAI